MVVAKLRRNCRCVSRFGSLDFAVTWRPAELANETQSGRQPVARFDHACGATTTASSISGQRVLGFEPIAARRRTEVVYMSCDTTASHRLRFVCSNAGASHCLQHLSSQAW